MAGSMTGNWWQYSRWVYVIGRSLRINVASSSERSAVETFIGQIKASRPWLLYVLQNKAEHLQAGTDPIVANQSDYAEAKMVMAIGRDLKKIPMTETEKGYCDTLITATGTRRLGYRGGPCGSIS